MSDRRNFWRDPTKYPPAESTSLHRWAFEFLMRNPTYLRELDEALNWQKAQLEAGASLLDTIKRIDALRARWGINSFPNWDDEHPLDTTTQFDRAPRRIVAVSTRVDRVALEFDIDKPLDLQLERAKHVLVTAQKKVFPNFKRGRNHVQQFPLYLRVLDALAAGVTQDEIAIEFGSHRSDALGANTLRHWIRKATALRDGGYRDLISQ